MKFGLIDEHRCTFPSRSCARCSSSIWPAITPGGEASQGAATDAAILRSLSGVGRIVLAVLLSEAAEPLARRDHAALHNLCGVAPVTLRSGKCLVVSTRRAAHVRFALYHWSKVAIQRDPSSGIFEASHGELAMNG
jgi:transposase